MNKNGTIVIVEDDADDRETLAEILKTLPIRNEIKMFKDGVEALNYLKDESSHPFIIISDINMPRMNGLQLRDEIQKIEHTYPKAIPFIFLTTAAANFTTINAYLNSVQGFFTKNHNFDAQKETISTIIHYWQECTLPKFF